MEKRAEIERPDSCLNKAEPHELIFVLLERDPAAPATVLFWAEERVKSGANTNTDSKIVAARQWAAEALQRRSIKRDK